MFLFGGLAEEEVAQGGTLCIKTGLVYNMCQGW